MANKYVSFVSDEHLMECIQNLYYAYNRAKATIDKRKFYRNKIDTIKLTFDARFNQMDEETLIRAEIMRQIDKSINNSIGTFHEQVLGGIAGYEIGNLSGFDIKATNNTLFADIKNKHNTMNSSAAESLFQKLASLADTHKQAKCYWVQVLAKSSFNKKWTAIINGKEYSHSRVYQISGDRFYALLTGGESALADLYRALPKAIADFMATQQQDEQSTEDAALTEIQRDANRAKRSIVDQISFENFGYYLGFDKL